MRRRRPRRPRAVVTAVVTAVVAVIVASCAACSARSAPAEPGPSVGQAADATLPAAVRGATLETSAGRPLSLRSLTGKIVVISDIMTLCQETCPLDTAEIVQAAQAVEQARLGDKVEFLSVTIDPTRDTTAQLAAYRSLYTPAPADWAVLTGSASQISALWSRLGVYIQRVPDTPPLPRNWRTNAPLHYDLTHSDEVFFLDHRGHERFVLEGSPHLAAGAPVPAALRRFMDAQGRANLHTAAPGAWTFGQELQVLSWLTGHHLSGAI